MKTQEFLSYLCSLDIKLFIDDGRLKCNAPKGVITPELQKELSSRKAEIIAFLQTVQTSDLSTIQPILPTSRDQVLDLSFAQQRLWFLGQLDSDSSPYHISKALRIQGSLHIESLHQALNTILARHEVLRTTYSVVDGHPYQVIASPTPIALPLIDLSHAPAEEQPTKLQQLLQQEMSRSFDLSTDCMLRTTLIRLAEHDHVLVLVMHHIASDGWSMGILFQELSALYGAFTNAFTNGQSSLLPSSVLQDLPIQYADFAVWQRNWLRGEVLEQHLTYWKTKLKDASLLQLPTDYPRPPVLTFTGKRLIRVLPPSLTTALHSLSQKEGVTLFMTLLTAFKILLSRMAGQEDVVIGSPIAGRDRVETETLIGFFINTVVMRTWVSAEATFSELLQQVRETTLEAYSYQALPFEKLVEELQPERDLSRTPIFQVWFNMLNLDRISPDLSGLTTDWFPLPEFPSKFDLTLYVGQREDEIRIQLVYNANLFTETRVDELLAQFEYLLEQVVHAPNQSVHSYSLVTPTSRDRLPDPTAALPEPYYAPVPELIEAWAQRYPEYPAILQGTQTWSYQQLITRARTIAHSLLAQGVLPGTVVAITGDRSFGLIAGILGIFLSGGVLLTVDPQLPETRQKLFLDKADAQFAIIVETEPDTLTLDVLNGYATLTVAPDTGQVIAPNSITASQTPLPELSPDHPAYIFFTSGTTGTPKGILGVHKGISHFLHWQRETFNVTPSDRVCQLTSLSFDALLRDIFLPLTSGAVLCLPKDETIVLSSEVFHWLEQEEISILHTVPARVQSWLMEYSNLDASNPISLRHLRLVFFSGEPLMDTLISRWRQAFPETGQLINLYGPTETTMVKCYYSVPEPPQPGSQPGGWAIFDTQALILTQTNHLCGIGELGEIVLRTPFRTLGYINAPDENQRRFIPNPLREDAQDLIYYTGDLGRYRPDGALEVLGRNDTQVKIRGVRIELGEIESVLHQHPTIGAAVVTAHENSSGEKSLVAYLVITTREQPSSQDLRLFLRQQLPDYMLPSRFMFLEAMPLLPNGKVDRRALPTPEPSHQASEETFVAHRDELERDLTRIWEEVLDTKPIGVRDNFFDLGGHSLLAVRLFAQIEKRFGKTLPLATLFQAATIEDLANLIRQEDWLAPWSSLVAVQPNGSKPPLFLMHGGGGNVLVYRDIALFLGPDQPIYGLQARGLDGKVVPYTRIEDKASHFIAQIKTVQPHGPYFLGGLSTGGTIAWEMAQQLWAQGEDVALLALFDTSGPGYPKILPPIPRLLSVLRWAAFDTSRRAVNLPGKLIQQTKQFGMRRAWTHLLEKLGIRKRVMDENQRIQELRGQKKRKMIIEKQKYASISRWEKWINIIIVAILKKSSNPYYATRFAKGMYREFMSDLPEALQDVQEAAIEAKLKYVVQVYPGRVIYFRASERPPGVYNDPEVGWSGMAKGGLEIYEIPGNHTSIVQSPVLGERLRACLVKAQRQSVRECSPVGGRR